MDQTRNTPLKRDTALEHAPFTVTIVEINEFLMFETPLWHVALLLPAALVLRFLSWAHRKCGSEFIRPSQRRTL